MIDKLLKDPNDTQELQKFAEAQFVTILDLNKKVEVLSQENKNLKEQLANSKIESSPSKLIQSDEEAICKLEIEKLRNRSLQAQLTYEESKKLQIYVELLLKIQNKPKTIEVKAKKMSDDDLLALINDDNETSGN